MHPYRNFPKRQFWSQAVANTFDARDVGRFGAPLVEPSDLVVSAGSCFAANLVPYLESSGFQYLRTEYRHSVFARVPPENMSYDKFSAGYGNVYTARQLHQLLQRCLGRFAPIEDRWTTEQGIVDPFRPGLRYHARSGKEFDLVTQAHLKAVRRAFTECDVFIFTLGLTEAWVSTADGAVFPACPGTVAGTFDPSRHAFVNFQVGDIVADLRAFTACLRSVNPGVRFIFTVSPVPLVATASDRHVLAATTFSKSVLRVAAEMICGEVEGACYFPAYEIVTGPQAPYDFFEEDRRTVSVKAVDTVMAAFLAACGSSVSRLATTPVPSDVAARLSTTLSQIECEEAAQVPPAMAAGP